MTRRFKCMADGYKFIVCDCPFNEFHILKIFVVDLIEIMNIDIVIVDTVTKNILRFTESFKSNTPVVKCFIN